MLFLNELLFLATKTGSTLGDNILAWAGGIGSALISVFLIFSLVKDAFSYVKGSGQVSMGKIISKVLVLIICIGLAALAMSGSLSKIGKQFANFFLRIFNKAATESKIDSGGGLGTLGE